MTRISIYDIEAEQIETLSDAHDVSDADVIEALFEAIKDNDIDINDYL